MLILSLITWIVAVYTLRTALFGHPVYRLLNAYSVDFLQAVEHTVLSSKQNISRDQAEFLQQFSRISLLALAAFVLELILLLIMWYMHIQTLLCLLLFSKNMTLVAAEISVMRHQREPGQLFLYLLELPQWLRNLYRGSALLSGIAFAWLFVHITFGINAS